jgi:hypothetical protein
MMSHMARQPFCDTRSSLNSHFDSPFNPRLSLCLSVAASVAEGALRREKVVGE